jgi:hypothetical protein
MSHIFTLRRKAQFLSDTPEFRRIRDLPRRTWSESELQELAQELTAFLKTKQGTMSLKHAQALALHDILERGGLFGPIRVGGGKTLITLLAPYMLQARNPLLLLPAGLIGKTQRDMQALMYHWKIPRNIEMFSYDMLGRVEAAEKLTKKRPDLIILDEAHKAKNKKAGVTKRLIRYMREAPETRVIVVSGTIMKDSLADHAHLQRWALKDYALVPNTKGETMEWGDALDEVVPFTKRLDPGPLLSLATAADQDTDPTVTARRGYRRRMVETCGVVCTSGDTIDASLYIRELRIPCAPVTEALYQRLRQNWERPDCWALEEAMQVWKTARELCLGFAQVWEPTGPGDWLNARRAWAKFVRETLAHSHTLDTPLQVRHAVEREELDDGGLLAQWMVIEPTFDPNEKALWHDDTALKVCAEWMGKHEGIVWVEHRTFGHRLSALTKRPYFGSEGKDKNGAYIEDASGPIIASIAANKEGRNLQHKWYKNLVSSCPSTTTAIEQMIGRTHRYLQKADTVGVDILVGCWEHFDAIDGARAQAAAERDTMPGSDQHKLLISDITWPTLAEVRARRGYQWMRTADAVKEKKSVNLVDRL